MKRSKINIHVVRNFISEKEGVLQNTEYTGKQQKLSIICKNGHLWNTSCFHDIKYHKIWCPYCSGRMIFNPLEFLAQKAIENGGKLLSTKYESYQALLNFECANGHNFTSSYQRVKDGAFCCFCSKHHLFEAIKNCQDLAAARGGECLSTEYISNREKMNWKCSNGHEFLMTRNRVVDGSWCSICYSGISERIARQTFETIFQATFTKTKSLPFLKISEKCVLELDGYNADLQLAFEYQGEQHFSEVKFGGKSDVHFKQSKYDDLKSSLCAVNNIKLFTIPYFRLKEIKKVIKEQAALLNVNLPYNYDDIIIDKNKAYNNTAEIDKLQYYANILLEKGFILKDTKWLGSIFKYDYFCSCCKKECSSIPAFLKTKKACCKK